MSHPVPKCTAASSPLQCLMEFPSALVELNSTHALLCNHSCSAQQDAVALVLAPVGPPRPWGMFVCGDCASQC
eukprot:10543147-Lingulodinium_polyedra.AAC.1